MLNTPDYLFICRPTTFQVVERNLKGLASLDVSFTTIPNSDDSKMLVCVFFSDDTYDVMAEILRVKTRLKMYDYMNEFKGYASELFEQYNSRQAQFIMQETFKRVMDIDYLVKARIVDDHYPLHTHDRDRIQQSWSKYYCRLMTGFITGSWKKYT